MDSCFSFVSDRHRKLPTIVYIDNKTVTKLASDLFYHQQPTHIDVKFAGSKTRGFADNVFIRKVYIIMTSVLLLLLLLLLLLSLLSFSYLSPNIGPSIAITLLH